MKPRKAADVAPPSPEQLAAYADGELDAATRDRVAAWLAEHDDAEVEVLRELDRLCQETPPLEPSEAEWAAALERIALQIQQHSETEVPATNAVPRRRVAGSLGLLAALGMTAAAAVVLALLLHQTPVSPVAGPQPEPRILARVLPVAADNDIEIVSVDAADLGCLVVGESPLRGPVVLAAAGDVILHNVERDPVDGMMPKVNMMDPNHTDGPMIVAPLALASNAP